MTNIWLSRTKHEPLSVVRNFAPAALTLMLALAPSPAPAEDAATDPHAEVFAEESYPSARVCKGCHEQIYWEWAS